jgi:hypothetical protein
MTTKVTLTVEEHQRKFANEIGMNTSKLLRDVIDTMIDEIEPEELKLLRTVSGEEVDEEDKQELLDKLKEAGLEDLKRP